MNSGPNRFFRLPVDTEEMHGTFSPNRSLLLTGGDGAIPKVHIWDAGTGSCLRVLNGHKEPIAALAWQDQRVVASGAFDRCVRLWDAATGECLRVLAGHGSYVRSVEFSQSQQLLLCGSGDGIVRLWGLAAGKMLQEFKGHGDGVYHAVFDPGQTRVLSGGRDRTIRLWDLSTGRCLRTIDAAGAGHVQCLAWHADGRQFLSCAGDIRLWDSETGECLRVFEEHADTIRSVAWSHDHSHILSASHDGSVRIWESETGSCLEVLQGHEECVVNAVWALVGGCDGGCVLSCDSSGGMRVFKVEATPSLTE